MTFNIKGIPCLGDNAIASIGSVIGLKRCALVNDGYTRSIRERVNELISRIQTLKAQGQEPDVILLQEAFTAENWIFDDSAVESIPQRSGYPYFAWGPQSRMGEGIDDYWNLIFEKRSKIRGLLSSGLLILSKHPIEAVKHFEFGEVCTIDDCASNKGVLLTRIRVASLGLTMDIANTHQQAGVANVSIRNIQSQLAASFIHGQRTGRILFFGGDFNYRLPNQEPAAAAIEGGLQVQHAGRECKALGPELCEIPASSNVDRVSGNSLDHIYFKGAEDTVLAPVFVESPAWTFGGGLPLSDHQPVIADF
jgi:endonuclease/exonuclease/phosphatase family metal-dependent hydrolase